MALEKLFCRQLTARASRDNLRALGRLR